jgi:hypothetical protein
LFTVQQKLHFYISGLLNYLANLASIDEPAPLGNRMTANPPSPVLSSFRGDFGALAAMMQRSWADNPNQPLLYSEEFLRSAFDYPGSSFELAPAIYREDDLLAFVTGFPRSVLWDTHPAQLVLNSFLTASPVLKGAGVGLKLWAAQIERCREAGSDGTINFCVEGDEMNRMMPFISRLTKLNTQRIFSVEFLVRLLRSTTPESPRQTPEQDIDLFIELASMLPNNLPLMRVWTRAEAEWHCRDRAGAITVSSRANGRRGILTGYLIQAASIPPTTVVLLEDLLWGDLEPLERTNLLELFLRTAASRGARTASCPMLGYSPLDTLEAARFRRSKRVLHTYLTLWNGLQPRPVSAIYMDVL